MDDLDDVREHLGYDQINLYGGSYGTRAALVYLRQHEPHVRTVVLDGVAPTDMRLPLFFARDAQRALDRLVADCAADSVCSKKFPDLGPRIVALLHAAVESSPRASGSSTRGPASLKKSTSTRASSPTPSPARSIRRSCRRCCPSW